MSNPQDPTESRSPEPPELPHPELKPPEQLGFDYPATAGSGTPLPAAAEHGAPPPAMPGYGTQPPPGYGPSGETTPSEPGMPSYRTPTEYGTGAGYGNPPTPGMPNYGALPSPEAEYGSPGWGGSSSPGAPTHGAPTGYGADVGWSPATPSAPAYGAPTGYDAGYGGVPPGYDQAPADHGRPPTHGAPIEYGAGYGGVPPGYDQAPGGHGRPGYGQPTGYGRPAPGYGGYRPSAPGYGYPPAGFGPPPPYASWLHRVGAAVLDGLLVGIPAWILDFIGNLAGSNPVTCTTDIDGSRYCTGGGLTTTGAVLVGLGALVGLVGGIYLLYLEGTTGQTPGKRVLGIKLIREADGQVMGFWWAVLRSICHILDALPCYLGYLWPLWDDKRQTFADKIMNTIVVKV